MALATTALALTLSASMGAWYVTGNTAEIGNWNPVDGTELFDDGVAPDEVAGDAIFTAAVTFTDADTVDVEYKISDAGENWYGAADGNNMQLDISTSPETAIIYLDLNDRSGDGWHPQAGWSLSDDHVVDHTWVAVGDFQTEAGEVGDWVPTSVITEMHDDGLNGDLVAGDGIHSFEFTPDVDLVEKIWKVVRQGEWSGSIKFGANGWSFDPGDSWNLTLNANAGNPVLFEFWAKYGWLRATVAGPAMSTLILDHDIEVAKGEVFHMTVKVINNVDANTNADVWVDAILPNGMPAPVNPIVGPLNLTLPPYREVQGPVSLTVPMKAPLGDYQIQTKTGVHGVETWDTQQVTTTVIAP